MKYIFSEEQFMTLLALAGENNLYLFHQKKDISDSAIIYAVAGLYRMGRLTQSHDRFVPSEELKDIIQAMGQSSYIIMLKFADREFSQHLVYPLEQGKLAVLENGIFAGVPTLKLWHTDINYYVHDLFENDMMPKDLTAGRMDAMDLEDMALQEVPESYDNTEILLQVKRLKAENGETDNVIDVFFSAIFKWIHVYGGNDEYYHIYSQEEFADLLLSEIKGAKL